MAAQGFQFAPGSVPQLHRAIVAGRGDGLAIRRKTDAQDPTRMAAQGFSSRPARSHSFTVLSSLAVAMVSPSGEKLTLKTPPVWPAQGFQFAPGSVPQLHRAIVAGRGDGLAIRRKTDAQDPTRMAAQGIALQKPIEIIHFP